MALGLPRFLVGESGWEQRLWRFFFCFSCSLSSHLPFAHHSSTAGNDVPNSPRCGSHLQRSGKCVSLHWAWLAAELSRGSRTLLVDSVQGALALGNRLILPFSILYFSFFFPFPVSFAFSWFCCAFSSGCTVPFFSCGVPLPMYRMAPRNRATEMGTGARCIGCGGRGGKGEAGLRIRGFGGGGGHGGTHTLTHTHGFAGWLVGCLGRSGLLCCRAGLGTMTTSIRAFAMTY